MSLPATMAAVVAPTAAATDLRIEMVPTPQVAAGELVVEVAASALNRADLLQRRGLYPPPPGASNILGLEIAGSVVHAAGSWQVGDRVMAVVTGGGYGQYVTVPAAEALALPVGMSFTDAAALPEAFLTAWLNLVTLAAMQPGSGVFIHAGASGVGTAALQLARAWGVTTYTAAGDERKRDVCRAYGAAYVGDSRAGGHAAAVKAASGGRGVDIVLDMLGAPAWDDNCAMLAPGGTLLLLGFLAGAKGSVDLGPILTKSLVVKGTTLRRTPAAAKAALVASAGAWLGPRFADGTLRPVVDRVFSVADAAAAHLYMESNANIGKIVLLHDWK